MNQQEAKAVEQVEAHAKGLRIDLQAVIDEIKEVTTKNPVGFDFTPVRSKTRDLLLAIIDSARFGYDDPSSMFGFFAGCVARHDGFKASFRQKGPGPSIHIQIGDLRCNAHIDSVGIVNGSDSTRQIFTISARSPITGIAIFGPHSVRSKISTSQYCAVPPKSPGARNSALYFR